MIRNKKINYLFFGGIIVFLIVIAFYFFNKGDYPAIKDSKTEGSIIDESKPRVISVNPTQKEAPFITQDQIISVEFNTPVENVGEFKHRIDPTLKYKLEISSDRKTIKIVPEDGFELGREYTLFISPETKFDGKKTLDGEKIYHFKTIPYRGV